MTGNEGQPTELHYELAHRVLEYARWSDLEAGAHLRETELADRFRVSRSPIRAALRLLAQRDIVEYTRHHGVFLRIPGRDLDPDLIGDMTTPEQDLYRRIVHDRLAGTLPDILSAAELGRRYAVRRSRLTRLLGHMANEGLVERLPGHRWRMDRIHRVGGSVVRRMRRPGPSPFDPAQGERIGDTIRCDSRTDR